MKPESRYIDIYNYTLCSDSFFINAVEQKRLGRHIERKLYLILNDHLLQIGKFLVEFLSSANQFQCVKSSEHRSVSALTGEITMDVRSISIYDQMWLFNWLDIQDYYDLSQSLHEPMRNLISFLRTDKHPAFSKDEYEETILRGIGY